MVHDRDLQNFNCKKVEILKRVIFLLLDALLFCTFQTEI